MLLELDRVKTMILLMSEVREMVEKDYPHLIEDVYKLERMAQKELEFLVGN